MRPGTDKMLAKALGAAAAARTYLERGALDLAAGRCFYAMLHAARALLNERGRRLRAHAEVSAALRRLDGLPGDFVIFGEWLEQAVRQRASADDARLPDEREVQLWLDRAATFTAAAVRHIGGGVPQGGGQGVRSDQSNPRQ